MRYALISDIHANLPALKSVYGHNTSFHITACRGPGPYT